MRPLSLESRLALLIGLFFGGWAVVVVPPVITFDGPGHFYRALQVTRGEFRAVTLAENRIGGTFAMKETAFIDGLWTSYWQQHDFGTLARWAGLSRACLSRQGDRAADITNTAIESPANHLIQGLGMRFAAFFSRGPLWASQIGCLFNLLGYLSVIVATIEILPVFRRGFLLFAVSPLILIQAASLSHDAINFSLPALFIAVAWRLRVRPTPAPASVWFSVLTLGSLVALLKPVALANLACFLLVPTEVFGSVRRRMVTLLILFGCAGALWLAWNLPYRNLDIAAAMDQARPASATALQKQWVWSHPFSFLPVFGRFLKRDLWEQWPVFFGDVGGWISPGVQKQLAWLSLVFLLGLIGAEFNRAKRDVLWAGGLFMQGCILLFGTCFVCWLALGTVGLDVVPGLGGRYLLLVYFAFFAALLPLLPAGSERLRTLFFGVGLAANVGGLLAILIPTSRTVLG